MTNLSCLYVVADKTPIDKLVYMYSLTRVLLHTIIMNKDIRIGIIHCTGEDCPFIVMFLTCLYCLILLCVFFQCMLYLVVFYFGDFKLWIIYHVILIIFFWNKSGNYSIAKLIAKSIVEQATNQKSESIKI